jgi:hypothetical protein
LASHAASCGCLSQLVWLSELRSTPTHGRTHRSSTRCTPTELVTIDGFHVGQFNHNAVCATAPGPTTAVCACGAPTPATTVSAHLVALLLLPPSSPHRCGVVHSDSSGAAFSIALARLAPFSLSTAPERRLLATAVPHIGRGRRRYRVSSVSDVCFQVFHLYVFTRNLILSSRRDLSCYWRTNNRETATFAHYIRDTR